jgi:hypothetical protein
MNLPDGPLGSSASADIFAAAERLGTAASDAQGIWVRKVTLENPR